MAIRIKLSDGAEIAVQASLDRWDSAWRRAIATNAFIEIQFPDGSIRPIDPRSIEWFREEPEAEAGLEEKFREAAAAG
jgi:hypothetical protein